MISPECGSILNPGEDEYVPPVVPVKDTFWPVEMDEQYGLPLYSIVADAPSMIVTFVVVE